MFKSMLMIVAIVATVGAQERISFDSQVSTGLGYRNPAVGVSFGTTTKISEKWSFDGSVRLMRARKIPGDGLNVGGSAEVRRRLNSRMFGIAGVNVSHQVTSLYGKTAVNPMVGVGWRVYDFSPSVRVLLPDVTSPNKTYGVEVRSEYYVPTPGRFGLFLETRATFVRFRCFQGPVGLTDNCNGGSLLTKVGVYRARGRVRG